MLKAFLVVSACAAAQRMPPPGWTETELNARSVSPLDLAAREQSRFS